MSTKIRPPVPNIYKKISYQRFSECFFELGERMLAITDSTTPIFDTEGNPTKSSFALLKEEFRHRFPVTNRRKDFFRGHLIWPTSIAGT